jgi:hypothetical protein
LIAIAVRYFSLTVDIRPIGAEAHGKSGPAVCRVSNSTVRLTGLIGREFAQRRGEEGKGHANG